MCKGRSLMSEKIRITDRMITVSLRWNKLEVYGMYDVVDVYIHK
jgi:hypothetical protein